MPILRIILVSPQEAGNVGAVARAMKNFGGMIVTVPHKVAALALCQSVGLQDLQP